MLVEGPAVNGSRASLPALVRALTAVDLAYTQTARAARLAGEAAAAAAGDAEVVSVAERALGMISTARGDLVDAEAHLRDAIRGAIAAGLSARAAEARGSLAWVLTLSGATNEALAEVDRAVPALAGISAARVTMMRALILTELARFDEADIAFGDALETLRSAGGDDLLEADVRTNRSMLYVHRRDWWAADNDLRLAEALYTATGHQGRTAMVFHNRGLAAATRGDLPRALSAYDEAELRYRAAGRPLGLLPIERAEGLLSVLLVAEAREAAEAAIADFTRQRNAIDLVQARLVLARAALLDGDATTALVQADLARRSSLRQHRPGWAALAAYMTLRARWEDDQRSESMLRAGQRAVIALTDAGWVVAALDARLIVARVAMQLGRTATARRELAEAGHARRRGPAELRAKAWHAEALLRLADGDRRGAESALRAGMRVVEAFRASLGATELRTHASGHGGELARLGLQLALHSGRPESVLEWAERWRAGALRLRPARPPDVAELAQDMAELRQVAGDLTAAAAGGGDIVGLLRRQTALEHAIHRRARHASGSTRPGPTAPTAPTARTLEALLGQRALVEYLSSDGVLHAVVIRDDRVVLRELGPLAAPARELDALRFGLRRLAYQTHSEESRAAASKLVGFKARSLDALLLAPLLEDIGDAPLVIVPTTVLHAVPWAVLPSCARRPVSVAPSAALWQRAVSTDAATDDERCVLVSGPGLRHASAEVAALARRYPGASRFSGRRARVEAVTAALDGAELVHIAAHGHFRADNPLFSSIRLFDGALTVYDLECLRRAPRHVVLSACDSGLPTVRPGDEVLGLAAALLSLGTTSLVATVVPVPDDASRPLMLRFHRALRGGSCTSVALATAQHELAGRSVADGQTAAGFVCFGAG